MKKGRKKKPAALAGAKHHVVLQPDVKKWVTSQRDAASLKGMRFNLSKYVNHIVRKTELTPDKIEPTATLLMRLECCDSKEEIKEIKESLEERGMRFRHVKTKIKPEEVEIVEEGVALS